MQREIVHKLEDMSIRLADSHAPLDLEGHFPDQAEVRRRAREAGVFLLINVAQVVPTLSLLGLLVAPLAALGNAVPVLGRAGVRGIGWAPAARSYCSSPV